MVVDEIDVVKSSGSWLTTAPRRGVLLLDVSGGGDSKLDALAAVSSIT